MATDTKQLSEPLCDLCPSSELAASLPAPPAPLAVLLLLATSILVATVGASAVVGGSSAVVCGATIGTSSIGTSSIGTSSVGTGSIGTGSIGTSSIGTSSVGTGSVGTSTIAASIASTVALATSNGELGAVVLSAALGHGHGDGLMVGSCRHGADAVSAGGKTALDGSLEESLAVTSIVDPFEEDELGRVRCDFRCEGTAEILNGDVSVANDLATLELLRSGVVGRVRVGEGTGREVVHLDLDVEVRQGLQVLPRLGEDEDRSHHGGRRRDVTHG